MRVLLVEPDTVSRRLICSMLEYESDVTLPVAENVTFNVRHKIGEQELQTTVTVRKSALLLGKMVSRNSKTAFG